jgi:hypothetical protein
VKINKDIALAICEDYFSTNITQYDLSVKYGLSKWEIARIVRGERWTNETSTIDRSTLKRNKEILVDMIDPATGEVVKTYRSMSEAMSDGHYSSHISDCCNGKQKQHHGYIWRKHTE